MARAKKSEFSFPIAEILAELREKYALSAAQERFLSIRLLHRTDAETARVIGMTPTTVEKWKWNTPKFRKKVGKYNNFGAAYRELMIRSRDVAEKLMDDLASKVVKRVEELLDAEKLITVGDEVVRVPDFDSRFKGIQAASHWMDKWSSGGKVEVKNQYLEIQGDFKKLIQKQLEALETNTIEGEVKYITDGIREETDETPTDGD